MYMQEDKGNPPGGQEFANFIVGLTKKTTSEHRLERNIRVIKQHIMGDNWRAIIADAAVHGKKEAVIFACSVDTEFKGLSIYDLLYPSQEIAAELTDAKIKTLLEQISEEIKPMTILDSVIYVGGESEEPVANHRNTISLQKYKNIGDRPEKNKLCDYMCVLTISWKHLI